MASKKVQNTKFLDPKQKAFQETKNDSEIEANLGVACEKLSEPFPEYIQAPCEKVIKGDNNQSIVLGRDRRGKKGKGTKLDGYGGKGHSGAGSIDICVGRSSNNLKEYDPETGEKLHADLDSTNDAAFIYLSQLTDIDDNMNESGLPDGSIGNVKARSAIGMKADNIRIVARQGIKITTHSDENYSSQDKASATYGVDLIAGNKDEDLQPMVKGQNALEAIEKLSKQVSDLSGIVANQAVIIQQLTAVLAAHVHISSAPGTPTSPSAELVTAATSATSQILTQVLRGITQFKYNIQVFKNKYLSPQSDKYINSHYNNVN